MASLFQVPTPVLGLMGQRRRAQQDPLALLAGMQGIPIPPQYEQAQFDAGDQQFLDRYAAQGYEGSQQPQAAPMAPQMPSQMAPAAQAAPAAPAAPRQRERVSGWRLLDRVLGGETITGGLDNERARLRAEALRPEAEAQQARLRSLAAGYGPAAELAFALNPTETGKAFASNLEGYTLGAGGLRGGVGGVVASAPTFTTVNDNIYRNEPGTGRSVQTATADPAYSDITARFNAENPTVAANSRVVNLPTGNVVAEGYIAPDVQNVAPGGEALVFDASGNVINRVGSTQRRPPSAAEIKRADDLELQITQDQTAIDRVASTLALITDPDRTETSNGPLSAPVRVGPWSNFGATAMNAAGMSNDNSRGIAQIRTTVEALRNSILQDANGVQTEGDALRALNAILAGVNDPEVIRQGFNDYLTAKRRTLSTRQSQLERMRSGATSQAPQAGAISREAAMAEARRRGLIP